MSHALTDTGTVAFLRTGDFTYSARVRTLARPQGLTHIRISTRWDNARDPQAEQTAFEVNLQPDELRALIALLQAGLNGQPT